MDVTPQLVKVVAGWNRLGERRGVDSQSSSLKKRSTVDGKEVESICVLKGE
jgi:hypothetical protein